jgi:hypothetical protein
VGGEGGNVVEQMGMNGDGGGTLVTLPEPKSFKVKVYGGLDGKCWFYMITMIIRLCHAFN